jgi:hypothetical protein
MPSVVAWTDTWPLSFSVLLTSASAVPNQAEFFRVTMPPMPNQRPTLECAKRSKKRIFPLVVWGLLGAILGTVGSFVLLWLVGHRYLPDI